MALAMHSDEVRALVGDYCIHYAIGIFTVLDLATPAEIWRDGNVTDGPGCYAIYDEDKRLRYIGASLKVRQRSCSHFAVAVQACKFWQGAAKFVQLLETRETWEPWSLESYLELKTKALRAR